LNFKQAIPNGREAMKNGRRALGLEFVGLRFSLKAK